MACATIHLAIAKKYLEKHTTLNYRDVIAGTLYPDAADNNDYKKVIVQREGEIKGEGIEEVRVMKNEFIYKNE